MFRVASSSSPTLITASFPGSQTRVFTASDTLQGSVSLKLETEGKDQNRRFILVDVVAKLKVKMITTFFQPEVDLREEKTYLYSEDLLLWSASTSPSSLFPHLDGPPPVLEIPWSFTLPGKELNLPPSFEGGNREGKTKGHVVARIVYSVKIIGSKNGKLTSKEKTSMPFIYMPPPRINPLSIPPSIVPRPVGDQQSLSPVAPPQPGAQDGWIASTAEKEYRESLFGKKSKAVVRMCIPSIPSFPRNTLIPYYLSILILAPEGRGETTPSLPSPSDLRLSLRRTVSTTAKKGSQKFKQDAGLLVDLKSESRIWYQPHGWVEVEGGGKRWGGEIVVVGEFELGGGDATPSFGREQTSGLLSCDYAIRLELPLKGLKNELDEHKFFPLVISSDLRVGQEQLHDGKSSDIPPDYFSLEYNYRDEKKEKQNL
ncbi:hypothetical protein BDY24DRAFT_400963 [Mrakia frigida]|uniref:uncharacterized protein n=1 Tax=Mrakia frigida TaxID=29902 RepID=UPI003FCBEEF3